jgi:tryptophan-rich sensory protein
MTLTIIVAAVITAVVLGVGGLMTSVGPWYRGITKPSWNPPDWLFGPAWTVILGLAAWAGVDAWTKAPDHTAHLRIAVFYCFNIVFHMAWSPLFFNLRRPDWALIEVPFLWLSILALILDLSPITPLCGFLLAPYLAWVSFAAVLNLVIARLNAPFARLA